MWQFIAHNKQFDKAANLDVTCGSKLNVASSASNSVALWPRAASCEKSCWCYFIVSMSLLNSCHVLRHSPIFLSLFMSWVILHCNVLYYYMLFFVCGSLLPNTNLHQDKYINLNLDLDLSFTFCHYLFLLLSLFIFTHEHGLYPQVHV